MKLAYPEWDAIRQLANGTMHAQSDQLMWERHDFWMSPGHMGGDNSDWFVEFEGKPRSLAVLIKDFFDKFEEITLRP